MRSIYLQQDLLLHALANYFTPDAMDRVVDVIEGRSRVSLRLLDWFATNFSKKTNVTLRTEAGGYFNIYMDYRAQLRAFSKQFFDPFRRKEKFMFRFGDRSVLTTIGQLNFFRWAITSGVLDYVHDEQHLRVIEADMLRSQRESVDRHSKIIVPPDGKKRRFELSRNVATKAMTKHMGAAVVVQFG